MKELDVHWLTKQSGAEIVCFSPYGGVWAKHHGSAVLNDYSHSNVIFPFFRERERSSELRVLHFPRMNHPVWLDISSADKPTDVVLL